MRKQKRFVRVLTVFFVFVLVLGAVGFPAAAENGQMTMKDLSVNVWPEYDSNLVEVGYYGTFVNDTGSAFQGEIRYNVPKGAEINMVCETEQGMLCQPYEIKNAGEYDQVVWKPSHPVQPGASFPVMIEYYYHPMGSEAQRQFDFQYSSLFKVENMTVALKQPSRSSEFTVQPEAQSRTVDSEGFDSYEFRYDSFQPGAEALNYTVSYVKNDNDPSVQPEQQQAGSEGGVEATTPLNSTVAVIIVAFLVLLGVIIVVALNNNNDKGKAARTAPKNAKNSRVAPAKSQKSAGAKKEKGPADERKKIRKMLLDGKISEQTYHQLIGELEEEE